MALCSIADVRAFASPASVSDADITAIIALVSDEIAAKSGGSASSTDTNLKFAGIHASVAAVLKKARSNGELAASVDTGNYKQSNTGLISEIKEHEDAADVYIRKYLYVSMSSFAIPYGRVGRGTVNAELE